MKTESLGDAAAFSPLPTSTPPIGMHGVARVSGTATALRSIDLADCAVAMVIGPPGTRQR
ncbi:hypothetical protein [Nocardia sp. CNY236]|uniref:hypothetical protein n=1 Tax=Nocardia sp. CNY236 TaxID=1169152 RepID=UPI0004009678|nr:hypothetical protein [Nocardia sp. CNY236]